MNKFKIGDIVKLGKPIDGSNYRYGPSSSLREGSIGEITEIPDDETVRIEFNNKLSQMIHPDEVILLESKNMNQELEELKKSITDLQNKFNVQWNSVDEVGLPKEDGAYLAKHINYGLVVDSFSTEENSWWRSCNSEIVEWGSFQDMFNFKFNTEIKNKQEIIPNGSQSIPLGAQSISGLKWIPVEKLQPASKNVFLKFDDGSIGHFTEYSKVLMDSVTHWSPEPSSDEDKTLEELIKSCTPKPESLLTWIPFDRLEPREGQEILVKHLDTNVANQRDVYWKENKDQYTHWSPMPTESELADLEYLVTKCVTLKEEESESKGFWPDGWISVLERMPEPGQDVLVLSRHGSSCTDQRYIDENRVDPTDDFKVTDSVIKWKPLTDNYKKSCMDEYNRIQEKIKSGSRKEKLQKFNSLTEEEKLAILEKMD